MQDSTLALVVAGATLVNIAHNLYWMRVNRQVNQSVDLAKAVKSEEYSAFKKELNEKIHKLELEISKLSSRVGIAESTLDFAKNTLGNPDKVKSDLDIINQSIGLENTGMRVKPKIQEK